MEWEGYISGLPSAVTQKLSTWVGLMGIACIPIRPTHGTHNGRRCSKVNKYPLLSDKCGSHLPVLKSSISLLPFLYKIEIWKKNIKIVTEDMKYQRYALSFVNIFHSHSLFTSWIFRSDTLWICVILEHCASAIWDGVYVRVSWGVVDEIRYEGML